jgi:hypothetical protein
MERRGKRILALIPVPNQPPHHDTYRRVGRLLPLRVVAYTRGLVWQIAATSAAAAEDEVKAAPNKKGTNQPTKKTRRENNQAKENLFIFNSAKIKCFPSRAFTLNYVNFPPFVLSGE